MARKYSDVVKTKKPKQGYDLDINKIIALHEAGWSYEKIGEEMFCTGATVYNHLKRYKENKK